MRFFDLFLRRAGVERAAAGRRRGTSRLTVVCPRDALEAVRKQICPDFSAAGLSVSQFQVDGGSQDRAGLGLHHGRLSPELRAELMSQARRLSANPDIRHVHFGAG